MQLLDFNVTKESSSIKNQNLGNVFPEWRKSGSYLSWRFRWDSEAYYISFPGVILVIFCE